MNYFLAYFVVFVHVYITPVVSEDIKALDNCKHGGMKFGSEDSVIDYASLAADPLGDLPEKFTICSSIHVKYVTTSRYFFQLYQEDGESWFYLKIDPVRDLDQFTEKIRMGYYGSVRNFLENPVPITPHYWYHACTGLDTDSGHLRVVINGVIVVDKHIEEFENSRKVKPKSLIGKLTIFKAVEPGFFYQARSIVSNVNIYGFLMTPEDMALITDSKDCTREGDYIAWANMEWNIIGNVDETSADKEMELCHTESSNIVLFTSIFVEWEECMLFCPKMQRARAPLIETTDESVSVMNAVQKVTYIPGTKKTYPGVLSGVFWIPITDSETEDIWIDYYSNKQVEILGAVSGELNGGTVENCGMMVIPWGGQSRDFYGILVSRILGKLGIKIGSLHPKVDNLTNYLY